MLAQVLIEFAHTLGTDFSIQDILDALVRRVVQILPVTGAGVMLTGEHQDLHFTAASDTHILAIEQLQNELHEGPGLLTVQSGIAVSLPDLKNAGRFSQFCAGASAAGLAAVFTFPLRLHERRLGALDLYRETAGPLSDHDMRAAQVLADVAAAYLFNAQTHIDDAATPRTLRLLSSQADLTSLPNRSPMQDLLGHAVARSARSEAATAVLFADLDGFKGINDRHGHHIGDQLLIAVANRLRRILRPGDVLSRLGGDEFVVVCEDVHDVIQGSRIGERVVEAFHAPFVLPDRSVTVTASVGVSFSTAGGETPQTLLQRADFAMYEAKRLGGDRYHLMDLDTDAASERRLDLHTEIERALDLDELSVAYQPIVDAATGLLAGVEALLRWHHPPSGPVSTLTVIANAERTGLIGRLGEWVLTRACRDLESWRGQGLAVPLMAVNVSGRQIMEPGFVEAVALALRQYSIRPAQMCLEITEGVLLGDGDRALTVLTQLADLGVGLALDDFGTGYSSLSYLRRYPITVVKIDRSFTADLESVSSARSIVTAVVALSHELGLTVTVEGVENDAELELVKKCGADHVQGFLFREPMTPSEFVDYAQSSVPLAWVS